MCGNNSQEAEVSAAQTQMYNTLSSAYNTTFGQQQQITGALTQMFTPILQAGPSQTGMAPAEEQALRTQADTGVATNYAQAQRATAQALAARGGGNTLLPDSTSAMLTSANANAAAQARSTANLNITGANYAQGYQNWQAATNALTSTAGLINPLGYASQSTGAGQAAASTAETMASQKNSIWNAAIGALGGIGGAALGNISSLMPSSGSSPVANTSDINPAFASSLATQRLAAPTLMAPGTGMTGGLPNFA